MNPRLVIDPETGAEREAYPANQFTLNDSYAIPEGPPRYRGPLVRCWRCRGEDIGRVCPVCLGSGTVLCVHEEHRHA